MRKRILVQLACLAAASLVAGCDSGTEKAATQPAPQGPTPVSAAPAAPSESTAPSTESIRFALDDSGRQQSLQLGKRADGSFDVTLEVTGACSRTDTGTAKEVAVEGDIEVMDDPEGNGHPVDTFAFPTQGNCSVTIQLTPERDYAWLKEPDCSTACPLSSEPMTRK